MFEKWLTPWKAQTVVGGVEIFFLWKLKLSCPAGQNLEIMTKNLFLKITLFDAIIFEEYY